jgi:hypothetical protein
MWDGRVGGDRMKELERTVEYQQQQMHILV